MHDAVLIATGVVIALYAADIAVTVAFRRQARRDLDEVRRCNDEFAEAAALFRYGAYDEAVEMARRWRERVPQSSRTTHHSRLTTHGDRSERA